MVGHEQARAPGAAGLEVGLEVRDSLLLRVLDFVVRIEGRGVCGDVESVGPVEVGGAQRDCGRVLDLEVEVSGAWEDAVVYWGIGEGVAAAGG